MTKQVIHRYLLCSTVLFLPLMAQTTPAASSPEPKLSARELFYKPPTATVQTVAVTKETTPPTTVKGTTTAQATPKSGRATHMRRTTQTEMAAATTTEQSQTPRTQTVAATNPSHNPVAEAVVPLGLRYSILKWEGDGHYVEVDPDTVLHTGDRMRVRVEANDSGYLYILHKGSSNTWSVMFPNSEVASGSNRVDRGRQYDMPPGGRFVADEQPGTERLFVVLTRKPEPDLERLIYKLTSDGGATPVALPDSAKTDPKLLAHNEKLDDGFVGQLQENGKVLARDLIFEKVDDSTATADTKERAVYVVNPVTNDQARLIVDISVQHK